MSPRRAEDRLRHLLVMLPWLMEEGEVPLSEISARFGLTEEQVTKELELAAMCGLPPYVDEMVDVFIDDGIVYVGVPRLFTRPLRLTAPEGFTLLAAGRAATELPGFDESGPLARGLRKLANALGADDDTAGVVVDLDRPPLTDLLADAVGEGAELAVQYYSVSRDELGSRTLVPRHVFTDGDHWYLLADDDRSGERRTFRIDRIESAAPTGVTHPTDPSAVAPGSFFDDDIPRATLLLAPVERWVVDRYPVDSAETRDDGWIEVVLPVSSERWLDRLLIRLGPNGRVIAPADRTPSELAARIRARYDAS